MSETSQKTRMRLISEAKKEFSRYGYEKASIRRIAKQAGIAPSSVYRHFKSKEELFDYFVQPFLEEHKKICDYDTAQALKLIQEGYYEDVWTFSDEQFVERIKFMYEHYDICRLLIMGANGTKYNDIKHKMVMIDVEATLEICSKLREKGFPIQPIDETELYLLTNNMFTAGLELITSEFSEEQAIHYSKTLSTFFNSGFKGVFGF